ncbi:MAG: hypothetical protein IT161_08510 [Bryobacterales bacterium]|nr:hypothetical protein [Bryobacterales bacterium]
MRRRAFLNTGMLTAAADPWRAVIPPAETAAWWRAAYEERDITPPIGSEQPGGYGKVFHKALHDPCKVRVAVFDGGTKRVALAGVDALAVPREVVDEARARISKRCGIGAEAVLISASHSHSSGPVGMVQPREYDGSPRWIQELAYKKSSLADPAYLETVTEQIAAAVTAADAAKRPMACSFGAGHEDRAAFNRRFRMKNGQTWTHPGQGNPEMGEPAGPIDPAVGVIGSWDETGKLAGCIVNYACHATTNPPGISANWIYYLEQTLRAAFGQSAVVVFLQGFCGDVTQVDNRSPHKNPAGEEWARMVGGCVGLEAAKVLLLATPGVSHPIVARHQMLKFARRKPSPGRLAAAADLLKQPPAPGRETEWIFAKETVMLAEQVKKAPLLEAEVQVIGLGPVLIASAPGEMFCQLGLDLRKRSQFPITFPVELANGCVGYVPTEEALGSGGGGYETRMTSYSSIEAGAGRRMVEAALRMSAGFIPGEAPRRAPAPPFKAPWSYGNVPPETGVP